MRASLSCGCELPATAKSRTLGRLFGLAKYDERRSGSASASTRAPWRDRSAVRRFRGGFSLRFKAATEACVIEPASEGFGNIQGAETRRGHMRLPVYLLFLFMERAEKGSKRRVDLRASAFLR